VVRYGALLVGALGCYGSLMTVQGWRGNVKSEDFVLALIDFYTERSMDLSTPKDKLPDRWALSNIYIDNLQPMLEACDSDASGFITVNEINAFTSSRPMDWSLPTWISYWAAGMGFTPFETMSLNGCLRLGAHPCQLCR
jgi:hypothetical protein